MNIKTIDIGLTPYLEALSLQEQLHKDRINGIIPDTLVFCEHPSVFTTGKQDCASDWISTSDEVKRDGIEVVKTNRGGKITYHGPGQLVCYFIFNIDELGFGVRKFVEVVESALIKALARFNVPVTRDQQYPGLWHNNEKLVAIGFHISRGVSMHGVAININPNMDHYRHIIPCGINDRGVTSIQKILGMTPDLEDLKREIYLSITSTEEKVKETSSLSSISGLK